MARPLFSHQMVFKQDVPSSGRGTWGFVSSPPADPNVLAPGSLAANTATLSAATLLYINRYASDHSDAARIFAIVRGGGGAGQSDVIVLTNENYIIRYKATADALWMPSGSIVQLAVSMVTQKGTAPTVGASMIAYIGLAAVA